MILAHGPIGYLLAYRSRQWWVKQFTKTQQTWLYVVAFLGGIFPDIDLFYFYFADASVSHRQFLTHSFIPYTGLLLLGIAVLYLAKQRWQLVGWGIALFSVGAYSHICADMLIGQAAILLPFNDTMLGLVSIPAYRNSWFMQYRLATNFTAEFFFIAMAAGTVMKRTANWWATVVLLSILIAGGLIWVNNHSYQPDGYLYYRDDDADGVLNAYDLDRDNDGITNLDSLDKQLVYLQTFSALNSVYDYSQGNLLEIPRRLGAVNDVVLTQRLFSNSGVFMGSEMASDYSVQPDGYVYTPTDNRFNLSVQNWQTWFRHTERWFAEWQEFDIAFFTSGHVGIIVYKNGQAAILDSDASHPFTKYVLLTEIVAREGNVLGYGRLLPTEQATETSPSETGQ